MRGNEFVKFGYRSSVGTVTVVPAVSGAKHHITKGIISVYVGTGAALLDIGETYSAGTNIGTFLTVSASAKGIYPFDLGDRGYAATATNTRIIAQISGSEAAVHCLFAGYDR